MIRSGKCHSGSFNPIWRGGGDETPHHAFVIPQKDKWEKLPFFCTFTKYRNSRLGTTFFRGQIGLKPEYVWIMGDQGNSLMHSVK